MIPEQHAPEPGPVDTATSRALGAGLGLVGAFFGALAFAFVLSRLVGGMYITFAMPIFAGTLIAALAAYGPRRFRFGDKRPLVLMMIASALVCWLGHHLLAYLRVADIVAAQHGLTGAGATEGGLRVIEQATGESGFFAYLTYVSSGAGATLSPIGYLGRLEPGWFGTALVALLELVLMAATASWSLLYRTRTARQLPPGPLALFDEATAARVRAALETRRFSELAELIRGSRGMRNHALVVLEGEAAAELALYELDALGRLATPVLSRLVPRSTVHALKAALTSPPARPGGADGARDP